MQKNTPETIQQTKAPKSNDRTKCILILLFLSLAASVVMAVTTGQRIHADYAFGTASFIGEQFGFALGLFLVSLLFFAVVRSMRKGSVPTAGLGTGIVVALILCGLVYIGATNP